MKWMIASDIHGSEAFCRKLLEAYDREGAERLLLLGDILYHGPRNALPYEYAPKAVISLLNERRDDILCVRGNCDAEVDQMVLSFPVLADYAWLYLDGLRIFATHGHKFGKDNPPPLAKGDVLLCGHTHIPAADSFGDGNFYINPGSVSIPKNGSDKGYIIYEEREFLFCTLDGAVYDALTV